ncbi:MAG: undecaprenyl-diphosphate phosphatase [Defluviitaleaceae bacterium]|jgi:undecaprenyl-diphosphatase|nr:undecaprenyl-diphosphate phosphatase [Defluviitaleaceae bacterium]
MSLLEAIILGLIQGISEFLPVSSSGHLLVFHHIFGITGEDNMTFIIVLNMGSLMPLLWVFRKDVWALIKRPFQKMTALLIIATLPLIIVTIFFQDFIEEMFHLVVFLPIGFVITGVLLILSDRVKKSNRDISDLRVKDAVIVGLAQACAVFPGLSRSGSTMTTSLFRGLDRESAAKFSFLMSIPTAFGAIALRMGHVVSGRILLDDLNFVNLGAGFITAAVSGYLAINIMLNIVKKGKLKYFAFYYVFALAIFVVVFLMRG